VEEGVTIAAGSTITDNSEKDSLLIARSRQQEKKNWKK
jgi:bifunctional N-acetylglucosamine-1-phosphate-uridyltransferase/glucosamine-1-phosphate-acetyltransferase GlmU-like protein